MRLTFDARLRTDRVVLRRFNDVLWSINVRHRGGNVDLLTDIGVRVAEDGTLFLPDDILCRFDGVLLPSSGILFPHDGILFPHSVVRRGGSIDLLTDIGVRTVDDGMLFLPDGILCRVNVVL